MKLKKLTPKNRSILRSSKRNEVNASRKLGVSYGILCRIRCFYENIRLVNEKGKVIKEVELSSTPEIMGSFLIETGLPIEKVGLESGCLTHYLSSQLIYQA